MRTPPSALLSLVWDHAEMERVAAEILSRAGNWAVVQMPGRNFPGLHMQGDTFAALRTRLAAAARQIRREPADPDALDELDSAVEEMDAVLSFYERVLSERGLERPY